MTLVQSRQQHFIALLIRFTAMLLFTTLACLLLSPFIQSLNSLLKVVTLWLMVNGGIFAWLALFNSGRSKLEEHSVKIDEEGMTYSRFFTKTYIAWSDVESWSVSKGLQGDFSIYGKGKTFISFSYFTFSSQQREFITDALCQYCPDKKKR